MCHVTRAAGTCVPGNGTLARAPHKCKGGRGAATDDTTHVARGLHLEQLLQFGLRPSLPVSAPPIRLLRLTPIPRTVLVGSLCTLPGCIVVRWATVGPRHVLLRAGEPGRSAAAAAAAAAPGRV